MIRFTIFLK